MLIRFPFSMLFVSCALVVCGPDNTTLIAQVRMTGQSPEHLQKVQSNEIKELADIYPMNHRSIGWRSEELGDLNGDGYDDYAVSSYSDTTWIFLGGDPIPNEPTCFVLGGGCAIEAADVNRDGHTDLITASNGRALQYEDENPIWTGCVQIFLNTGELIPFHPRADQILKGDSTLGIFHLGVIGSAGRHEGIKAIDINGDGNIDLLCTAHNLSALANTYVLFMNGFPYSTSPDKLLVIPVRDYLGRVLGRWDFMTGDLNGDGRSDIMVFHSWRPDSLSYISGCEVFLGNEDADVSAPQTTLGYDSKFWISSDACGIADINADGCDDIFNGSPSIAQYPVDVWYGRPNFKTIDPPYYPLGTPDPSVYKNVTCICPVGDMNGDGTRDVLMGWSFWIFRDSMGFHFHGSRADDKHKQPFGSVGLDSFLENIDVYYTYPVGDVNGDGYDDIIFLGHTVVIDKRDFRSRFKIFGGSNKLVGIKTRQTVPEQAQLRIFPNPGFSGSLVNLEVRSQEYAQANVHVLDALGRSHYSDKVSVKPGVQSIPLQLHGLATGYYWVELRWEMTRLTTGFVRY